MFLQLWNQCPDELKTTKQDIIYTNVTEDLYMKKIISITITESMENIYHGARQNLNSVQRSLQ